MENKAHALAAGIFLILVSTLLAALTLMMGASLTAHAQQGAVMAPDQIDARHKAAKEQCDAMSGDQKSVCLKQADAEKDKAEAQAKAGKEKAEADRDAAKTRQVADYDVEMKKCDALSGDAQDKCEADVKTRFGK